MRINNNISALNANRNLGKVNQRLSKTMEKLSSGLRISRASDDSAGLAISEKLRGNIKGAQASGRAAQDSAGLAISEKLRGNIKGAQASGRAAQDAISVAQVGEAALEEATSLLTRAKELKVQYTATSDATAQGAIEAEMGQIASEVTNVINNTKFNGSNVFQTSSNLTYIDDIESGSKGSLTSVNLIADNGTAGGNGASLGTIIADGGAATAASGTDMVDGTVNIDTALNEVVTARSTFGSYQSRLESVVRSSNAMAENYQAAESRVRDADMASEMVSFTKDSIIQQAAQSMLTQANQLPQSIIGLLQ